MKKLTETDLRNLKNCPTERWFKSIDVWPIVKRPEYALGRLIDAGKLQTRVIEEKEYFKPARYDN